MDDDFELCSNSSCSASRHELIEKIKSLEFMVENLKTPSNAKPTVYVKCWNKLKRVSGAKNCCGENCWKQTTGYCKEGNGCVWICIDGTLIKYSHSTKNMESDNLIMVLAEKEFMRADIPDEVPENAYVCRFFEVTALPDPVKEAEFNWFTWELQIGLRKDDKFYRLSSDGNYHSNDGTEKRFLNNSIVGNDVFGCGHIIPPKNKPNEPTQIFFTLNKKQIGKTILLHDVEDLLPHILVKRCDARINFGTDDSRPFTYEIQNHEAGD
ncbi:hypothetical protein ACQ4LE_008672 [Meloidogyne hapla]|uniref:SPRY domain-containing protein n=1 Tax=Meloidogyne hapla TaxID=6305 RepID=A0A1I8BLW8_MELHA